MATVNSYHRRARKPAPMPTPSRTSTEQIVASGRAILEAEGFEGLTMQRVAAAVGVRAPSLYKRVDGRGELVRLITVDVSLDLSRALEAAASSGDPAKDLAAIALAFRRFAHAWPEAVRAALPPAARGLANGPRPRLARVREAVRDGRGDRRPRRPPGGRPHGGGVGERVREHGARGGVPAGRRRRPGIRLWRRAHRRSDQRAAARRATMNDMRNEALVADLRADRGRRPRPGRSRAPSGLRARLDRPLCR